MGNILTHEALYDTLRREKTRGDLQKLPEDFFKDVSKYLFEKKEILKNQNQKENVFAAKESQRTELQLKSSKKILGELIERREFKILQLALSASKTNQDYLGMLHDSEKELYDQLKDLILEHRQNTLNSVDECNLKNENIIEQSERNDSGKIRLRFLNSVPEFIAEDMEKYGPFEKGNEAEIPSKVGNLLIDKKNAEEV